MSAELCVGTPAIRARRVAGHIGAEVSGVDLAVPVDDATIATIRAALLEHKVLFFRGQQLGHAEQVAFARRFGDLTYAHPYEEETPPGYPEILTVDTRLYADRYKTTQGERRLSQRSYLSGWHSDLTPLVNPTLGSVLRADTVPEYGGDTTWSNLVAAYLSMSPPIRALADGLLAEHRFLAGIADTGGDDGYRERVNARPYVAVHPVVRVHPETGERALFVNPTFTSRIVDMSEMESRRLLDLFFERIALPAFTVRFRWELGSVAFWDNRATAHMAPTDLDHLDIRRRLYRVSIAGDVPVGPDGSRSQLVAGEPFPVVHRCGRTAPRPRPSVSGASE